MRELALVFLFLVACGRADTPQPQPQASAQDPWAQPAAAAPDPWSQPAAPPAAPAAPATPSPPPARAPASRSGIAPGRYACWLSGMGNYTASTLGTFTFGADGSYQTTSSLAGGTYRVDGGRLALIGGKLDGWVAAIEPVAAGARVRFRADTPADPGASIKIGDHVCMPRH